MRNTRKPKPAFEVGQRLGGLTIIEYEGFLPANADLRCEHNYRVRCTCKKEETKKQGYLKKVTSKLMCTDCTNELKRTHMTRPAHKEVKNSKTINSLWPVIGDIT